MGYFVLTYFCIAVFIIAAGCLIYRHLTLPLHVRWEIYPVRHETAPKNVYGGSFMENVDWWKRPYETSRLNEFKYMVPEILLLRGLRKENKSLWYVSFPFHMGLYLMTATLILMLLNAGVTLWGLPSFAAGGAFRPLMDHLIAVAGWAGLIAGTIGNLGLLYRRLTDRDLKNYSTFSDYANLSIILLFFLIASLAALSGDPFLDGAKAYVLGLLTAGKTGGAYAPGQTVAGALTIVMASLLVAYIPLTHMSHMFMKYFLYHSVKWDDVPNRPGTPIESAAMRNLQYKPTWQAKHIGADGQKSWRDIASSDPKEKK
jgi:nitrate reductase gamma subunit